MSALDPPEPVPAAPEPSPSAGGQRPAAHHGPLRLIEPFRFLQASDFRLDTPCYGVMDLPEGLRDRFVDARYLAAERVFDAALQHDVDFLVLPGGLLDARLPGLRGPWFLAEQFRRLADQGIAIYWAGSTFETRGRWPAHAEVPANVHRLRADHSGLVHRRQGRTTASLLTIPPGDIDTFRINGENPFTIAVQPRSACVPERWQAGIDYWALGGQSHHETEQVSATVAHFAGSPQGRSPSELGRHSCSLVHVAASGGVQIEPIATNIVRWHHERLDLDVTTSWSALEQRLRRWNLEWPTDAAAELVMVHWTVIGCGLAVERLLQPGFNAALVNRLNQGQIGRVPAVWTVGIEALIDADQSDDWQAQETSLGAFLRELHQMEQHVHEMLGTPLNGPTASGMCAAEANERIVKQVRNEGVHRLGTDERITVARTV